MNRRPGSSVPTKTNAQSSLRRLIPLILAPLLISCATRQSIYPVGVIPPAKSPTPSEEQYGQKVLQELTQKTPLDYSNPRMGEVQRIVDRLAAAAKAQGSPWQVYLLKDPHTMNAAATRGNHIFVWSGMLDFAKDEGELASILAHEMAHVLAGHTDPDPSEEIKRLLIQVGAMAAGTAASIAIGNAQAGNMVGQLASDSTVQLGSAAVIYPNSRAKELEADRIGIFLMADAGYDPESAVKLWTRAQNDPAFSSIPFLSTHPGAEERLVQLKSLVADAKKRQALAGQTVIDSTGSSSSDISIADTEPVKQTKLSTNSRCVTSWTVKADKAVIYSDTDPSSKALGELSKGASVCALSNRHGWIRVQDPDAGFISASDLSLD